MRFDEVVRLLRQQEKLRAQVAMVDAALELLDEEQRELITRTLVRPERLAADKMCEKFGIEETTVYRRRRKALEKLGELLGQLR